MINLLLKYSGHFLSVVISILDKKDPQLPSPLVVKRELLFQLYVFRHIWTLYMSRLSINYFHLSMNVIWIHVFCFCSLSQLSHIQAINISRFTQQVTYCYCNSFMYIYYCYFLIKLGCKCPIRDVSPQQKLLPKPYILGYFEYIVSLLLLLLSPLCRVCQKWVNISFTPFVECVCLHLVTTT